MKLWHFSMTTIDALNTKALEELLKEFSEYNPETPSYGYEEYNELLEMKDYIHTLESRIYQLEEKQQRLILTLNENNQKQRRKTKDVPCETIIRNFVDIWNKEYVCPYFRRGGCGFDVHQCSKIHYDISRTKLESEFRAVYLKQGDYKASQIFSDIIEFCDKHDSKASAVANNMIASIKKLCC